MDQVISAIQQMMFNGSLRQQLLLVRICSSATVFLGMKGLQSTEMLVRESKGSVNGFAATCQILRTA